MKSVYLIQFFLLSFSLFSQKWEWAKKYGNNFEETGNTITVDKNGNSYIAGYVKHFSNGAADNYMYAVIWKLDPNGKMLWQDTIKSAVQCGSATNAEGFTYVIYNNRLVKYDPDGNILWNISDPVQFFYSISLCPTGGVVVAGSNMGATQTYISKFDENSNLLWQNSRVIYGYGHSTFESLLTTDNSGNIYYSGGYKSDTNTINKRVLTKLNSSGTLMFHKMIPYNDQIKIDNDNSIYLLNSGGGFEINNQTIAENLSSYLIKFNSLGVYQWHKEFVVKDFSKIMGIAVDMDNNVIVGGTFIRSIATGDAYFQNDTLGSSVVYAMKIDKNGKTLSFIRSSGCNGGGGHLNSLAVNQDNQIMITGVVGACSIFDNTNLGYVSMYGDLLVAKISGMNNHVGISENNTSSNVFNIYPNPNSGNFTLDYQNTEAANKVQINIFNLLGSVVYSETVNDYVGSLNKTIHTVNLPKGAYFISLRTSESLETRKIIIQ